MNQKNLALVILDGFGISDKKEHNSIYQAFPECWNSLMEDKNIIKAELEASGNYVGLPDGQMGNSEVGHQTIGAGRVLYQDLTRINKSIQSNNIENDEFKTFINNNKHKKYHLVGLLSDGGVHSHIEHYKFFASYLHFNGVVDINCHVILDGRDTPPQSSKLYVEDFEKHLQFMSLKPIQSVSGRFYAMDRDKRWERTEQYYKCITEKKYFDTFKSAAEGIEFYYGKGIFDEHMLPFHAVQDFNPVSSNDVVFFINFRPDRARQICTALADKDFKYFPRNLLNVDLITLTEYQPELADITVYPKYKTTNTLGDILTEHNLNQFRIAETEKYAHVTYFFNCGREDASPLEERHMINSKKVLTYDTVPEMSAKEISDTLCEKINSKKYNFLLANFANPDMVGHTGNMNAAVESIKVVDNCLRDIVNVCKKTDTALIITSDHGNAECMFDEVNNQPMTAHTTSRVPFIYIGQFKKQIKHTGELADIAPTILNYFHIPVPSEMTGQPIVEF